MNEIVKLGIAEESASLLREVDVPIEPFGYGTDLDCVTDVTKNLDTVDAFSRLGIAQALVRRLITPRGQLIDDPNYGLDVRGMLNRGVPDTELRDLAGQIRSEITKDDRVVSAAATVTFSGTNELRIVITVEPADPSIGGFEFTLALSSADVVLEAIR